MRILFDSEASENPTKPSKPQTSAERSASVAYRTKYGKMIVGTIENALSHRTLASAKGKVDLLLTSPPFPLVRKKRYGNETGEEYVKWLESLAPQLADQLSATGSLVIELGNSWVKGSPTMSTLTLEALLAFKRAAGLHLCQHVICHNPARLPTPAEWVTVKRIRLKDSFTHVWWLSKNEYPKANNSNVLNPYSKPMQSLLKNQKYNAGKRPSGHKISKKGFLIQHQGSISPNVLRLSGEESSIPESLLSFSGASWNNQYREYCKKHSLEAHPARMAPALAAFFISFLTDPSDTVFDPFAGSNTTGAVAEALQRNWIAVEANPIYVEGSKGRFDQLATGHKND